MDGGAKSSSIPSNPSDKSSKSSSTNDFSLGSVDFPSLVPSKAVPEKGVSNPTKNSNLNFLSCVNGSAVPAASSTIKLAYVEPRSDEDTSFAFFSAGDLQPHIEVCENFIVGYFVGRRLDFDFVKQNLESQWNIKGNFSMTIHGEQAFLFKFSLEEDRARVLEMGYMHIASKLFLLRPWSPFIEQQVGKISSVPIWMVLRDVPLHLWNATGFSRIASLVGKPIMTDAPTAMMTRMAFARVCVEIEANCSYPSILPFQIEDKKYEVRAEYPWKPTACPHCKSFGHTSDKCSLSLAPKYKKIWVPKNSNAISDAGENGRIMEPQVDEIREEISREEQVVLNIDGMECFKPSDMMDNVVLKEDVGKNGPVDVGTMEFTYSRKFKRVERKEESPKQDPICCTNSFNILDADEDNACEEIVVEMPKIDDASIDKEKVSGGINEDSGGRDEYVNDIEDIESRGSARVKVKSLAEIPRRIPLTREQEIERIVKAGALLGVKQEGKTKEEKKVHSEIMDRKAKERTASKKDDITSQEFGRGKRTSVKKKIGD